MISSDRASTFGGKFGADKKNMADYSSEEDWRIARRGLSLFLNNKPEEAESLFALRSNSFHTKTARCFVLFMNALMTFEDEKLVAAVETLKNTERECASDAGWLKSISRAFKTEQEATTASSFQSEYAKRLERQIVLADTKVCSAMLTLLQQEVSGYVRGGWMMRKAWRIYQHTYLQILQLYRRTFGTNPVGLSDQNINPEASNKAQQGAAPPRRSRSSSSHLTSSSLNDSSTGSSASSPSSTVASSSPSSLRTSISMFFSLTGITAASSNDQQIAFVEPAEVVRLMSAVSFGYGIFQLCVSLVPPSLLKLIHLLGFEGDRRAGLTSLMYARLSDDMRAPLATLSLLCYHTIVRPFCSLHDWSVSSGVDAAKGLIAESHTEFNDAALFLFFTGRTERLQSNIEAALEAYGKAIEASAQREIKLLCLHEMAWCHLIRLNYAHAHVSFARLQRESRWSESIYAYLAAVCAGADDKPDSILRIHGEITGTLSGNGSSKLTQLDLFVLRRVSKLIDRNGRVFDRAYYRLLVYELLYLWNALPSSSRESLDAVISECKGFDRSKEEPMIGLADLIAGAAQSYRGENVAAIKSYRKCLDRRGKETCNTGEVSVEEEARSMDRHVSAFALYELGSILCATSRTEEGKIALIKAQTEYSDYDFENRLNVRIHSALKATTPSCSYAVDQMSSRNACCRCNNNSGSNSSIEYSPTPWYCKLLKPITFFVVTTMLAISAIHLWGEYAANGSFSTIKSDLSKLRSQLSTLSIEVKNMIETRDELRSRLQEVDCVVPRMSEAIGKLREEVTEEIGAHTKVVLDALSPDNVRDMVKSELKTYDADKTGRTDYALESLGGSIISTRDTELYTIGAPALSLLGIFLCQQQNTPRTVIQASSLPGECWAFKGTSGSVVIRLMGHIRVTGVSLEHISSAISPDGATTAAPRDFSVWGLDDADDKDGFLFGEFTYDNRPSATPLQYFPVQFQPQEPYEMIEIRIHSNSGNPDYTCVYRIRVHGNLENDYCHKSLHSSTANSLTSGYHLTSIYNHYLLLSLFHVYMYSDFFS